MTKQSTLESSATARARRDYASLEELDRTLDAIAGSQPSGAADSYQIIASEIERLRGQEDGLVAIGRIAGELSGMREDFTTRVRADLSHEFDLLRKDIERQYAATSRNDGASELAAEFERLSASIRTLADRSDDRHINLLRLELEQVRGLLQGVAREDSLKTVDKHVADVAGQLSAGAAAAGAAELVEKLESINVAVGQLPRSSALDAVDAKVKMLAVALDGFTRQQETQSDQLRAMIAERLDEIARGIPASDAAEASRVDTLKRLEMRILALAEQIEEVAGDHAAPVLGDKLDALTQRVDDIETLVDYGPRFETLERLLARHHDEAAEQQVALVEDIDRRLEAQAARFEQRSTATALDQVTIIDAIEERLASFARQLEGSLKDGKADNGIETRLTEISHRLDETAALMTGLDPDLIRSLEVQVAELNQHLLNPSAMLPDLADIRPRLEEVEKNVAAQQDAVLEAARRAAEQAVADFADTSGDAAAVAGLAADLKALEQLTRNSEERSVGTFEAVHETLSKIAERLAALEANARQGAAEPARQSVAETPSIDVATTNEIVSVEPSLVDIETPLAETPAKPSAPSRLGGLSRALRLKKSAATATTPTPEPVMATEDARPSATSSLDEPLDPKLANIPLEPGSGTPDLNTILKRVRDEREKISEPGKAEMARADFIAAARRAAQAAAAEASGTTGGSETAGAMRRLRLTGLFRRNAVLAAAGAVLVALAALQIGTIISNRASDSAQAVTTAEESAAPAKHQSTAAAKAEPKPATVEAQPAAPQTTPETASEVAPPAPPQANAAAPTAAVPDAGQISPEVTGSIPEAGAERFGEAPVAATQPPLVGPQALMDAVGKDDPSALFETGAAYAEGRGTQTDMKAAAYFYEKAANLGLAPAQYRIGNMYEKGNGVERDLAKAKTWYQLAAAQGNGSAMHNLAVLFAMGTDGTPDNDSAARWFVSAAELGVKDSQFNLGILNARGIGMPRNVEESYKWFALAAQQGDADAAVKQDEIAKLLTPEQLQRAQDAARLWKPRLLDRAANVVDVPQSWQTAQPVAPGKDMTKAVETIQSMLNKFGYDAGKPDGKMGQKTRDAIRAFQKDNAMTATGTVDQPLVQALLAQQ